MVEIVQNFMNKLMELQAWDGKQVNSHWSKQLKVSLILLLMKNDVYDKNIYEYIWYTQSWPHYKYLLCYVHFFPLFFSIFILFIYILIMFVVVSSISFIFISMSFDDFSLITYQWTSICKEIIEYLEHQWCLIHWS